MDFASKATIKIDRLEAQYIFATGKGNLPCGFFRFYQNAERKDGDRNGLRCIVDDRNEKLGRKIRDNELKRIPYMLIVGEKEAELGLVSVRQQGAEEKGQMTVQEFADMITATVKEQMNAY